MASERENLLLRLAVVTGMVPADQVDTYAGNQDGLHAQLAARYPSIRSASLQDVEALLKAAATPVRAPASPRARAAAATTAAPVAAVQQPLSPPLFPHDYPEAPPQPAARPPALGSVDMARLMEEVTQQGALLERVLEQQQQILATLGILGDGLISVQKDLRDQGNMLSDTAPVGAVKQLALLLYDVRLSILKPDADRTSKEVALGESASNADWKRYFCQNGPLPEK